MTDSKVKVSFEVAGAIAGAIKAGFDVLGRWLSGRETRRLKVANEAAEQYIFVNEKTGEYKEINKARQKKLLKHYRKRFFAYD